MKKKKDKETEECDVCDHDEDIGDFETEAEPLRVDDFEDGETHFPLFETKVKPKIGRLLIFPPTWNYLHQGLPPQPPSKRGAKYFIMTHLVYVDEGDHVNIGIDFSDRTEAARDQVSVEMDKKNRGLQMWPKNH